MFNIEMPFISIVKDAEMKGIKFDLDYMQKEVSPKLMGEYEDLKKKIFKYTGEINLNSPLQVSKVLYDELKLPIIDKKKGKSTDKKTLQKLKNYHECIPLLLEYRSLSKLIDSFVDKLPKSVIDGRIHPNFRTIGCVTGRMSCSNPNLQQMPSHNNMIRKAFVADEGRLLVSIDFSGQELRILTHITKDPLLLDLYKNNGDVHAMTGVAIYNKMYSKNITYEYFQYCRSLQEYFLDREGNLDSNKLKDDNIKELFSKQIINTLDKNKIEEDVKNGIEFEKVRKNYAKMVNFGVIYGITENGLSNDLNITEKEAKQFIDSFYSTYKGVAKWVNDTKKQVLEKGYVTTLCGRKRRFYPYLTSGERWKVETAFRMACNSQIQGSATDQIKIASIKLQPLLKELDAHIVLFIHDEIIFDVPENIGMKNLQRIADVMCNALVLDCGMKSDIEVGRKWSEKLTLDEINELEVK
jgi:DNA polymerase-1